jgi:hypothetical protein
MEVLKIERTRRNNMLKVISAAALIAATAGLALIGAVHAAPSTKGQQGGISVNGTSLKGQTAVSGSAQMVGLVLPNGAAVSVR